LHHVYRACDLYVTPAYAETFAHPLVETMASGLPIVASDLPVHREVCGESALYFPRFSPESLAKAMARIAISSDLAAELSTAGKERSADFSWARHVESLLSVSARVRMPERAPLHLRYAGKDRLAVPNIYHHQLDPDGPFQSRKASVLPGSCKILEEDK
jgi:hypothetical protein